MRRKSMERRCPTCATPLPPHKRYCSVECMPRKSALAAHLIDVTHTGNCLRCGAAFVTHKPNKLYCSAACRLLTDNRRRRSGRGAGRRFPRIRDAARQAVFERDRWLCGICGAPIDPAIPFPQPGFGTVDHIDPFGAHEPGNWQAAHLACNIAKGRRATIGGVLHAHRVAA